MEYGHAVRAIAEHNSRKHTVNFKESPLGFLLVLCDTLQEWNRVRFGPAVGPTELLARLVASAGGEASRDVVRSVNLHNVERSRTDGTLWSLQDGKPLVLRLEYMESIEQNFGTFNVWLDSTANLQRLRFEGLDDLDIAVEYVTPGYRGDQARERPYSQLYRLRDAARETHMAFLEHWFPPFNSLLEAPHRTRRLPIEHHFDPDADRETLRLNIRELTEQNPRCMTGTMKQFRTSLRRWKEYSGAQDYQGDYGSPDTPAE
jgi:hypothetical protein